MAVIPRREDRPSVLQHSLSPHGSASKQEGGVSARSPLGACAGWIVQLAAPVWTAVTIHVDLPLNTVKIL